jgi:hypothetical protein
MGSAPSEARGGGGGAARSVRSLAAWIGTWALLVSAGLVCECNAPIPVRPVRWDAPVVVQQTQALRLLVLGDTGLPNDELTAIQRAVMQERFDVVLALGDLIYPYGPSCRAGSLDASASSIYAERLGAFYKPLQKLTLMVIGNHEVDGEPHDPAREACFIDYAAAEPLLYFPAMSYSLDFGVAALAVINTNALDDAQARVVQAAFRDHTGWKLLIGHHVLRTYYDKEDETALREWLRAHQIKPDLYLNGHAHLQQFGVYDDIPAATTGATSKLRDRPACPPDCGEGQLWGQSVRGYVMLDVTPARLSLTYRDADRKDLWQWRRDRDPPPAPSPTPSQPPASVVQ